MQFCIFIEFTTVSPQTQGITALMTWKIFSCVSTTISTIKLLLLLCLNFRSLNCVTLPFHCSGSVLISRSWMVLKTYPIPQVGVRLSTPAFNTLRWELKTRRYQYSLSLLIWEFTAEEYAVPHLVVRALLQCISNTSIFYVEGAIWIPGQVRRVWYKVGGRHLNYFNTCECSGDSTSTGLWGCRSGG